MRSLRLIVAAYLVLGCAAAQQVTKPETFFGYRLGADRHIARWDKIVEYYGILEKQSGGRMKVTNVGKTSEGNPFLMVIITSPANMAKLGSLAQINTRLTDPRGLSEAEARKLADEGSGRGGDHQQHARHRNRRHANGSRTGLRPARPDGRGYEAHPRQRHLHSGAVLQPGRQNHRHRLVQQAARHALRRHRSAGALPEVRRPR